MPGMRHQPQGLLRINRENPISWGLRVALHPQRPAVNLVDGTSTFVDAYGTGSSWLPIINRNGRALANNSSPNYRINGPAVASATGYSTAIIVIPRTLIASNARVLECVTAQGWNAGGVYVGDGSRPRFCMRVNTGIGVQHVAAPTDYAVGESYCVVSVTEAGKQRLAINGVVVAEADFTPGNFDQPHDIILGSPSATRGAVEVGVVFAWDRALSADEAAAVSANPWNLFAEDDDDWLPSLGAGYSLSVGRAALGVSGGQVGMRVSRRLRAAPAALAVTAGPVATRAARRLRVDPAALAVLAGPTRMLVSRRFGVQPAVLAVAGKGVTLRAGRRLPVASASLVLAGGQVGMQYNPSMKPGEYTLPVSAAAMTLGGGSVGMRVSRRLHVAPSSLVVVGGDVLFRVGRNPGVIDVWSISPARIVKFESSGSRLVIFEGSGSRVVVFEGSGKRERFNEMSAKVPIKVGEKWTVDLDRDEISYHAADITAELADRNTTADADAVTVLLYGVELLEGPVIQVAMIDGVERTFVVVKLGGLGEDPPADWRWVARVPCMNGERFDKSTWFNEVDP